MKTTELKSGYYMYGNKGCLWGDKAHIAKSGDGTYRTLCGTPMLATNWCQIEELENANCPECNETYHEQTEEFKCDSCEGSGEMKITMQEGFGKDAKKTESTIECVICHGTGFVDKQTKDEVEFEENMWCKCGEDHGVDSYKDGEHHQIHKHHYRCKKCKDVVQIG